jgi:hypothetical protein
MLPILIYTTLLFWISSIIQVSLLPFWLGDLVFLVLFAWGLFFIDNTEKYRLGIWLFWIPPILGLGMVSFLFYSFWALVPYLLTVIVLTTLIIRKKKWVFRFKEGSSYSAIVFFVYAVSTILIRTKIINYALVTDYYLRFFITFVLSLGIWVYFVMAGRRVKIR